MPKNFKILVVSSAKSLVFYKEFSYQPTWIDGKWNLILSLEDIMTLSNVRLKCGCFKATVAKLQMFGQGRSFSGTKPFVYPCAGDQLDPHEESNSKVVFIRLTQCPFQAILRLVECTWNKLFSWGEHKQHLNLEQAVPGKPFLISCSDFQNVVLRIPASASASPGTCYKFSGPPQTY